MSDDRSETLLKVDGLITRFRTDAGVVTAVDGLSRREGGCSASWANRALGRA